ncbi:MAG: hypothetical protein VX938_00815 [Myxococcota bacterium]|nr:hypothetical protein [Myxococcota bacterium]
MTVWSVTISEADAGQETLRVIRTDSGKHYASGTVRGAGKKSVVIGTHQERGPEGSLNKYRRKEQVRLGKGLFAFRSSASVRIKAVNQSFSMAELEGAARHLLWDPRAWHTLAHWAPRLSGAKTDSLDLRFFDVDNRQMGKATATRHDSVQMINNKGETRTLTIWLLNGLSRPGGGGPSGPWYLGITSRGALAQVRHSGRQLLREGWSPHVVAPEPPPEEEPADDEGANKPAEDAAKDDKVPTPEPPPGSSGEAAEEPPPEKGEVGDGP